ncbi:MAG: type VI secretion protein IcmF/TssM N-terminal domain-containing protein [Thermodesulfobacteriota bacterium]
MQHILSLVSILSPYLPVMLTGLVFLIAALIGLAVVVVVARKKKDKPTPAQEAVEPAPAEPAPAPAAAAPARKTYATGLSIAASFRDAVRHLRAHVAGRNFRYQIPWFVTLGQSGSGKSTMLRGAGLDLPFGEPEEAGPGSAAPVKWWFFSRGIVIDLAGDLVLGSAGAADDRSFDRVLRLLQRHRHQKPIDGVVLTVPADELYGPGGTMDERVKEADRKAVALQEKLWRMQKRLGLRLPVYLVVTKCDVVEGFSAFARDLPDNLRSGMFGWSNPYTVETAFTDDWADQAFASLDRQLTEAQIEVFASRRHLEDAERSFLFPVRFRAMYEPLRSYLRRIFKESVYHESFFLRGVYFTGAPQREGGLDALARTPVFVRDLLGEKVFPEYNLARPAARSLVSRNRSVLALQAATLGLALVWGLGLWSGYASLREDRAALKPLLQNIAEDVSGGAEDIDFGQGFQVLQLLTTEQARLADFGVRARRLFEGMANVRENRMTSVFIPSSWMSRLHRDISRAMTVAYDQIIMKAMFLGLVQKTKEVMETATIPAELPPADKAFALPEETREFKDLKGFVEDLRSLERHLDVYNNLKDSTDEKAQAELVSYLFGIDLPEDFFRDAQNYHETLKGGRYRTFRFKIFRIKSLAKYRKLTDLLYRRVMEASPVPQRLAELRDKVADLEKLHGELARNPNLVAEVLARMRAVDDALARPEFAWMNSRTLNLGGEYQKVVEEARDTPMIGSQAVRENAEQGEVRYVALKRRLAGLRTDVTGSLLQVADGNALLRLQPEVVRLRASLEEFAGKRFMAEPEGAPVRLESPEGLRLMWNTGLLSEAVRFTEPYRRFVSEELPTFPADLQETVRAMGAQRLEKNLLDLVAKAQRFEPPSRGLSPGSWEDDARMEVRSFKDALPFLLQLVEFLDQYELPKAYADLAATCDRQAYALLLQTDALLERDSLFLPRENGASWWDGTAPFAFSAFGVSDKGGLVRYLDAQKSRIRRLAYEFAEPLVSYFLHRPPGQISADERLILRWERIIRELDRYDNKVPENSLAALEKVVLNDLNDVTLKNFMEKIPDALLAAEAEDLFAKRRISLLAEVRKRCEDLTVRDFDRHYADLAEFFNRYLSGRFPFSLNLPGPGELQADPEDVREFYRVYLTYLKSAAAALSPAKDRFPTLAPALEFLVGMDKVGDFFKAYLGQADMDLPEFGLAVEFRTNQESEQGGHRVIDWEMDVGSQRFRYQGERTQGFWRFGDPVKFTLRWAKDSSIRPFAAMAQKKVLVEDRSVTYDYRGPWALLELVRAHATQAGDFLRFRRVRPHTLKFEVETVDEKTARRDPGSDQVLYTGVEKAKVFVRVELTTPPPPPDQAKEKPRAPEPLLAPEFPVQAPAAGKELAKGPVAPSAKKGKIPLRIP